MEPGQNRNVCEGEDRQAEAVAGCYFQIIRVAVAVGPIQKF